MELDLVILVRNVQLFKQPMALLRMAFETKPTKPTNDMSAIIRTFVRIVASVKPSVASSRDKEAKTIYKGYKLYLHIFNVHLVELLLGGLGIDHRQVCHTTHRTPTHPTRGGGFEWNPDIPRIGFPDPENPPFGTGPRS